MDTDTDRSQILANFQVMSVTCCIDLVPIVYAFASMGGVNTLPLWMVGLVRQWEEGFLYLMGYFAQ